MLTHGPIPASHLRCAPAKAILVLTLQLPALVQVPGLGWVRPGCVVTLGLLVPRKVEEGKRKTAGLRP
jgi:hypothetical protein